VTEKELLAQNEKMREVLVAISECAPNICGDCYGAEIARAALGISYDEDLPDEYECFRDVAKVLVAE
jgi:hypothetical protein